MIITKRIIKPFLLSFILVLPSRQIQALTAQQIAYTTSGIAGASFVWALLERIKKNKISKQLVHSREENKSFVAKLEAELTLYKNESIRLEQDQSFLVNLGSYIKIIYDKYAQIFKFIQERESRNPLIWGEEFLILIENVLKTMNYDLDAFKKELEELRSYIVKMDNSLNIKTTEWETRKNLDSPVGKLYQEYIKQARVFQENLSNIAHVLDTVDKAFELQKNFIALKGLIAKTDYAKKYMREIAFVQADAYEHELLGQALDKHILATYSTVQFPYLNYGYVLEKDFTDLDKVLKQLKHFAPNKMQAAIIEDAQTTAYLLKNILEQLVVIPTYIQEKKQKPLFDQEQQRTQAELKEKQERLNAELQERKTREELKLQREHNRIQELANQKAELDRMRDQYKREEQKIALELARIRNGEDVTQAIKNTDYNWQVKYGTLQVSYNDILNKNSQWKTYSDNLKKELDSLKLASGNNTHKINQLQSDIARFKENISRASYYINGIENALVIPPCNPDAIEGLRTYINNLQTKAAAARNALS